MDFKELNANTIFSMALETLAELPSGAKFTLSDLFLGWKWRYVKRAERILAGKLFLMWVESNLKVVEILEKKSQTQYYLKK